MLMLPVLVVPSNKLPVLLVVLLVVPARAVTAVIREKRFFWKEGETTTVVAVRAAIQMLRVARGVQGARCKAQSERNSANVRRKGVWATAWRLVAAAVEGWQYATRERRKRGGMGARVRVSKGVVIRVTRGRKKTKTGVASIAISRGQDQL